MRWGHRFGCALLVTVCAMSGVSAAIPFDESGADRVRLRDGTTLQGIVLRQDRTEIWMAVERTWLEAAQPRLAQKWQKEAHHAEKERRRRVIERIDAWLKQAGDGEQLRGFLESERERLQGAPEEAFRFYLRCVPRQKVRTLKLQPPKRRQVYVAAWVAGIDDVCTKTVGKLRKELDAKQIAIDSVQPGEFIGLLPPKEDSPQEWRIRQALVEFQYGTKLVFQGTPAFWIAVDERGQIANAENLGLDRLIGDILGNGAGRRRSPLEGAIAQARKKGVRGFLVKELRTNASGMPQAVDVRFYVVLDEGRGVTVLRAERPVKPAGEEAVRQLEQDPQIAELLKLVRSLGLPLDGGQLQMALGAGAGVQQAMRDADAELMTSLQTYARSLDTPLWWSEP